MLKEEWIENPNTETDILLYIHTTGQSQIGDKSGDHGGECENCSEETEGIL